MPGARPVSLLGVLLCGVVLVSSGVGAYFLARETNVFALRTVEVEGASPEVAARVREALSPYVGSSLVGFDVESGQQRLLGIPELADFRFDRAFPHTLHVRVQQERQVAVLRRGAEAWVVAASARVLRRLDQRPYPPLPRIWLPPDADIEVNATLAGVGARAVRAIAPLEPLRIPISVRSVRSAEGELTLVLLDGRELRLGSTGDLRLKLAIAKRILPLSTDAVYVDVSVPERPVAGTNPQVVG